MVDTLIWIFFNAPASPGLFYKSMTLPHVDARSTAEAMAISAKNWD